MTLFKQLNDYRLTTAEIIYHLPDYPDLLQSFIWQELDLSPDFPVLTSFLEFWEKNIEGKMHSVAITNTEIIKPAEMQHYQTSFELH
tara:strand:+ start:1571 stop:1831 length:261 start_codon:yes stop_codon:yes gene_type:complete